MSWRWCTKRASLTRKNVVDKPGTTIATGLPVIDGVSLLVEQNSWQDFPKDFWNQFWWGCRWSLFRLCWCAMTSCYGRLVETRLILQKGFLELLLELRWYPVKVGVPSNKFKLSICVFWELSPIWARSSPSRWALRCGILTRLFLATCSRSATMRVPFQTFLPA